MGNLFENIQVPATNGVGMPTDVSAMGKTKTFVIGGGFRATVNVEYSTDNGGTDWAPLATFHQAGNLTIDVAAQWIRAVTSEYVSGTPNLDVGATDAGATFVELTSNGAAVDISELPPFKTVVVPVGFVGTIDVSEDGTSWAQIFNFAVLQPTGQSREVVAQFARVNGSVSGTPVDVYIGGSDNGSGGGGSSAFDPTTAVFMEDFINSSGLQVQPGAAGAFDIISVPSNIGFNVGVAQFTLLAPTDPGALVHIDLEFAPADGTPPTNRSTVDMNGCATMRHTIYGRIMDATALLVTDDVHFFLGGEWGIYVGPANRGNLNWWGVAGTPGSYVDLGIAIDNAPHRFDIVYDAAEDTMTYYIDNVARYVIGSPNVGTFGRWFRCETSTTEVTMSMAIDYDRLELTGIPR